MQSSTKKMPRRLARMKAFQFLYGQGFCEAKNQQELENAFIVFPDKESTLEKPTCEGFVWELISGVWNNIQKLDTIIQKHTKNWRLDRVGRVELGLLRLSVYEMLFRDDIPLKVAINEALELNKQFGEEQSRAFLNGVLDAVAKDIEAKIIEL